MSIELDAGSDPPVGVATPSVLTMFVGDVPRQLLIFSGIARPEWDSNGNLDRTEVFVNLGAQTTASFTWTASIGLTSISNENSDFIFGLDDAVVFAANDGFLKLRVPIAVDGEPSKLNSFSYDVHVLSDPISPSISGLISWSRAFGDPSIAVQTGGAPMFEVALGQTVRVQTSGPFADTTFAQHSAVNAAVPGASADLWVCAYQLTDVPLGIAWEVRPSLYPGTLVGPPRGYLPAPHFNPDPQRVTLSAGQPAAVGVDFVMTFEQPPR